MLNYIYMWNMALFGQKKNILMKFTDIFQSSLLYMCSVVIHRSSKWIAQAAYLLKTTKDGSENHKTSDSHVSPSVQFVKQYIELEITQMRE